MKVNGFNFSRGMFSLIRYRMELYLLVCTLIKVIDCRSILDDRMLNCILEFGIFFNAVLFRVIVCGLHAFLLLSHINWEAQSLFVTPRY